MISAGVSTTTGRTRAACIVPEFGTFGRGNEVGAKLRHGVEDRVRSTREVCPPRRPLFCEGQAPLAKATFSNIRTIVSPT